MKLKDLLYRVGITSTVGKMDKELDSVSFDSRKVEKNGLFVAVRGTQVDGHDFIEEAIKKGAATVVLEELPDGRQEDITYIVVRNSSRSLGIIASNFFGNPSAKLKLVGITGTNGKTTTASLLFYLFRKLGYNSGLLSTVKNQINEKIYPATHTTADAITLNQLLAEMVSKGVTHCFMEVSSHSLDQGRTAGLTFAGAVFTNITHDHLDYHSTFENYIEAKKKLFDELSSEAFALTNVDDRRGRVMLQNTLAKKYTFGYKNIADFKGRQIANTLQGLELDINGRSVWFRLIGGFNAYNIMAVYAAAVIMEEDEEAVLTLLSEMEGISGRFERISANNEVLAIIDYAHTPDALENVLDTIDNLRSGAEKVFTVLGCGGDRDKTKRPLMSSIACRFSSIVIITTDNPRFEKPEDIIQEMTEKLDPIEAKKVLKIMDREEAIKTACMMAQKNDIILVAGKGHEKYQDVKGVKYPFDDKEVLMRMLKTNSY